MEKRPVKYPIGRQDFAAIRQDGFIYVDKTEIIYNLVSHSSYVFLSRPRRFGKSLLLSTIRYYFEGRKELFEGLKISEFEKEWKRYPVLHLELSRVNGESFDSLKNSLDSIFSNWESQFGITNISKEPGYRFGEIIRKVSEKHNQRVVILIDEYDNPLLNSVQNSEIYCQNRALLKSVYSNLKSMDEYIKFGMLTGVSRFSNMSVFSGTNNLQDITLLPDYSSICGFTEEEIKEYFKDGITRLAEEYETEYDGALKMLKKEYDGYHFSRKLIDIYNPFSLLNCLQSREIDNFWFKSGFPNFLAVKLNESRETFNKIFNSKADSYSLSAIDVAFDSPVALLFQTGYLTIKKYLPENKEYILGIPNSEVDRGLFIFLLGYYSGNSTSGISAVTELKQFLEKGNPDEFFERFQSFLAKIPYNLEGRISELYFERILFVIFHILGFHVHSEMETSDGRIDLQVETKEYIYIIELKLDGTAEEALRQINEKSYDLGYKFDGRRVFKIGVKFSSATRNISDWIIE